LFLVNGTANAQLDVYHLKKLITTHKKGLILLQKGSELEKFTKMDSLGIPAEVSLEKIKEFDEQVLLRFSV